MARNEMTPEDIAVVVIEHAIEGDPDVPDLPDVFTRLIRELGDLRFLAALKRALGVEGDLNEDGRRGAMQAAAGMQRMAEDAPEDVQRAFVRAAEDLEALALPH